MLNLILAVVAAVLWSGAYGWYFSHDLAQAWRRFRDRRELGRQCRVLAYEAWMRRAGPVRATPRAAQTRSRPGPLVTLESVPMPPPRPMTARPDAKILPFPAREQRKPKA